MVVAALSLPSACRVSARVIRAILGRYAAIDQVTIAWPLGVPTKELHEAWRPCPSCAASRLGGPTNAVALRKGRAIPFLMRQEAAVIRIGNEADHAGLPIGPSASFP